MEVGRCFYPVAFALLALPFWTTDSGLAGDGLDAAAGKALFERSWIEAPASTDSADGLGPLYTERSCSSCHKGAGGAQFLILDGDKLAARGLVARFGTAAGAPDPLYGAQLQTHAVSGLTPEGRLSLAPPGGALQPLDVKLSLNGPVLDPATRMSIRQAPDLGRALLIEKVAPDAVMALADPNDDDGDGISGRTRLLETGLGRFGWKAGAVTMENQIANAFALDIGLSSPIKPDAYGDCTALQMECRRAANGNSADFDGEEVSSEMIALISTFLRTRAARPRGDTAGGKIFAATGCAACHVPSMPAREGGAVEIFSDLLLHDMGTRLDDGVGEPGAGSAEWRTTPLSNLAPNVRRRYLHDARAATLDEAVRAHGGEADESVATYQTLPEAERAALIRYLEGL